MIKDRAPVSGGRDDIDESNNGSKATEKLTRSRLMEARMDWKVSEAVR